MATHGITHCEDDSLTPFVWKSREGQIVRGLHYTTSQWQRAYASVTTATIRQALGRARATLPEGIPAFLFTTDPFEFEVCPPTAVLPASMVRTLREVREEGRKTTKGMSGGRRRDVTAAVADGVLAKDGRTLLIPGETCCPDCHSPRLRRKPAEDCPAVVTACDCCGAPLAITFCWGAGTAYEHLYEPADEQPSYAEILAAVA